MVHFSFSECATSCLSRASSGQLLMSELVAMPASIGDALNMAKAVSHWMFGFYFVGVCFSAVSLAVGKPVLCPFLR